MQRRTYQFARQAEAVAVMAGLAGLLWLFSPQMATWPGPAVWAEVAEAALISARLILPALALAFLLALPGAYLTARAPQSWAAKVLWAKARALAALPIMVSAGALGFLLTEGVGWLPWPRPDGGAITHLLAILVLVVAIWPLLVRALHRAWWPDAGPAGGQPVPGGLIVAGLVVVEASFRWPGLGALVLAAANAGDLPRLTASLLGLAGLASVLGAALWAPARPGGGA